MNLQAKQDHPIMDRTSTFKPIYLFLLFLYYSAATAGLAHSQSGLPGPGIINTLAGTGLPCTVPTNQCGDGGTATNAQLNSLVGVAIDALGNIYIADSGTNRIRKVTSGNISTVAGTGTQCMNPNQPNSCGDGGPATSAQLSNPRDVKLDGAGNIYIADTNDQKIRVVNTTATQITVAGISINPGDIQTIAGTGTAGYNDNVMANMGELNAPVGIALDAAGNIYIADEQNNRIRAVNASASMVTIQTVSIQPYYIETIAGGGSCLPPYSGCSALEAELDVPQGVALDRPSNLYIANTAYNIIAEVGGGTISTVAGGGTGGCTGQTDNAGDGCAATSAVLANPFGVTVDAYGNIFIADQGNQLIREVTKISGIISAVAGNDGKQCEPSNATCGDGALATSGNVQLSIPQGVAVDPSGNLYIGDTGDNRLRAVGCAGLSLASISKTNLFPGDTVTLTGCGFGNARGNSVVQFGYDGADGTIQNWNNYQIVATVPSTGFTPGNVAVRVNGVFSNGIAYTVPLPNITGSLPAFYPTEQVTLHGNYFGNVQGAGEVRVGPQFVWATVDSWNNNSITFEVPSTNFSVGTVSVYQYAQVGNEPVYPVNQAVISSMCPPSITAGMQVVLTGNYFGTSQGSGKVEFGSYQELGSNYIWNSNTQITVTVPSGVPTGNALVWQYGQWGVPFSYTVVPAPGNLTMSPTSGPVGTPVIISGTNLGTGQCSSVTFNGVTAALNGTWTNTSIPVRVPAGATTGPVNVIIGGLSSNVGTFTVH